MHNYVLPYLGDGSMIVLLHWFAGFIVLAEGLNKLERTAPLQPGLSARARLVVLLKVFAWILLVLGAAGAIVRPFVALRFGDLHFGRLLITDRVSVADLFVLGGFALLIVRSRFKEPKP
jgi:hypothetical protein